MCVLQLKIGKRLCGPNGVPLFLGLPPRIKRKKVDFPLFFLCKIIFLLYKCEEPVEK